MLLGDPAHFTREHFEAQRGSAPVHLCELVVHCLELVSQLVQRGLDFRFKGGNSLLVLLEDPQRFSIDVDIVTTESKERLLGLVGDIAGMGRPFTRFETRAPRTKPWLPMISFKLFFDSCYQKPEDAFVMLDAVLEPPAYPGLLKPVRCGAIYRSAMLVEVPSVSGLIGDKLLAIGPSTLGIPLGKNKEAQRLKHVFDVALLSRQLHDMAEVRASLAGCRTQEMRLQGREHSFEEIVEDTLHFLGEPLTHAAPPVLGQEHHNTYLGEIVRGFDHFRQHLFRLDYTWDLFREDCRRVVEMLERSQVR